MPNQRFGTEYAAQKKVLDGATLVGECAKLPGLRSVLGQDGPDRSHAGSLDRLRDVALNVEEADRIMEAAGFDPAGKGVPQDDCVRKAGALKFLRHLYMVGARGSQQVWVLSTPAAYTKFPQDELLEANLSHAMIKAKLEDVVEKFDTEVRKRLGEATQAALAWVEAGKSVLSCVQRDPKAMAKFQRWFGGSSTTVAELEQTALAVLEGFKKMASSLNQNLIVITDMPKQRSDASKATTEAFILASATQSERPRAIYIEQGLFSNYDVSVLHDMKKNWTRVIVHECSHIESLTKDNRYGWNGIGVGTTLTAAAAAVNADTWAFFAADCAGALTQGEITRALGGTAGKLTKLPANWN
jgi:hypothetical protein